ncbi:hypothetical protein F0U64_22435 [Achromobacter xylosoxidans]|uniref:hypothetical protein n=1 Tax=Alcaligenes xylosoxydans xylosoxydans TaxID=85698 RepID=UPI00122F12F4|nr:hypothetical protein [Achromobacter xylosoxidans]QEQ24924.1 hypothetical protein F0U64_22435 [Achromobacter xylosoxidans]
MATYSIHYRLDQEKIASTYDQRYRDLQKAIARVAGDLGTHVDSTSSVWIRTKEDGESIAKTLKLAVDPRHDVVLVKHAEKAIIFGVGETLNPTQFEIETGVLLIQV